MSTHYLMNHPVPRVCVSFSWVGQGWESCDRCARPYWQHTHIDTMERASENRIRRLRKVITRDEAFTAARKWRDQS